MIRTMAALAPARWPANGPHLARPARVLTSRTTRRCHGWVFLDEPVQRATSRISSSTSPLTDRVEKRRTERKLRTNGVIWVALIMPRLCREPHGQYTREGINDESAPDPTAARFRSINCLQFGPAA